MALLSRPFALFDVRDVEGLALKAINDGQRVELRPHQRDDLCAYLIGEIWALSLRFDPARGSFAAFAYHTARLRKIDWLRKEHGRTRWQFAGRTYERERPLLVSLDGPDRHQLDDALATGGGDPASDSDQDLGGVVGARDSARARDDETLGLRPPRRAA